MAKLSMIVTFLMTVLGTFGGAHLVVWWRLVRQTQLPTAAASAASAALFVGAFAMPLSLALVRRAPQAVGQAPLWVSFVWMGSFFYLFLATLSAWLLEAGVRLVQPPWLAQLPAATLPRLGAGFAVVVAVCATLAALDNVRRGPYLTVTEVPLARLPATMDGLRVVQLSDVHVAGLLKRDYVERVVALAMAQKPDVVVLTGDLVDGDVPELEADIAPLGALKAPLGTYVITGNHEYYSGADAWLAHYARLGMRPLRNEHVVLARGGAAIDLAGIDDWTAHNFGHGHGADLDRALRGHDPARCVVLLAHQPRAAAEAEAKGVDLLLSGHTHGGQLWPFGYLVRLVQPYLQGLSRLGKLSIYVNRGTGYWGPPMRLGAPAEVSLLVLRARPDAP